MFPFRCLAEQCCAPACVNHHVLKRRIANDDCTAKRRRSVLVRRANMKSRLKHWRRSATTRGCLREFIPIKREAICFLCFRIAFSSSTLIPIKKYASLKSDNKGGIGQSASLLLDVSWYPRSWTEEKTVQIWARLFRSEFFISTCPTSVWSQSRISAQLMISAHYFLVEVFSAFLRRSAAGCEVQPTGICMKKENVAFRRVCFLVLWAES